MFGRLRSVTNIFDFLEPEFKTGSIIVATLNLVVYGCNREQGLVYCMNPLDPYNIDLFEGFLSTQSVLLIRKEDVLKRLQIEGGDYSITSHSRTNGDCSMSSNAKLIPAAYIPGFTVVRKV
jgi:hypothetical protein